MRKHVIVHGRVQGVGFRVAVQHAAEARRVTGFVRNRADGSVEAVLEGDPDAVEALVRLCREGPRLAQVSRVEVNDVGGDEGSFFGFTVR